MADKILTTRFLLRNDTAENWVSVNPVLLAGEVGIEIDTKRFKIGDGVNAWDMLGYANVLPTDIENTVVKEFTNEDPAIEDSTLLGGFADPKAGDVAIVTTVADGVYYRRNSFIYSGTAWLPFGGYVDASKAIMPEDLTLAGTYTQVGNITKGTNETKTLETKGKSVYDVLKEIFSKRLQPTATQPSVTGFALDGATAVEAGTAVDSVTLTAATLNPGSYTYGPATNIVPLTYSVDRICDNADMNATALMTENGGTDDNGGNGFIIGDLGDTDENTTGSLKYKMTITYGDGVAAKDNLGDPSNPEVKISAGSKSQTTSAYTSYRNYFYGTISDDSEVDSAVIRGLTKSNAAYAAGEIEIIAPAGAKKVIVACISGKTGVTKVINESSMNANITENFVKSVVSVEGANGYKGVNYNVWVFTPSVAFAQANTLAVTLG